MTLITVKTLCHVAVDLLASIRALPFDLTYLIRHHGPLPISWCQYICMIHSWIVRLVLRHQLSVKVAAMFEFAVLWAFCLVLSKIYNDEWRRGCSG